MHRRLQKLLKNNKSAIQELSESKQMDTFERENSKFQYDEGYIIKQQIDIANFNSSQNSPDQLTKQKKNDKYSTMNKNFTKNFQSTSEYNSSKGFSTLANTPYQKQFATQKQESKQQSQSQKNEDNIESLRKRLFQNSSGYKRQQSTLPKFEFKKLYEQNEDNISSQLKKSITQYKRNFSGQTQNKTDSKLLKNLQFHKLQQFQQPHHSIPSDQNNPKILNKSQNMIPTQLKKKLLFQTLQQNPIIKQINEQLLIQKQKKQQQTTNYMISRKNQKDFIKRKIIQSRTDIKKFYQDQMVINNVQFEYRKTKFFQKFTGHTILQHQYR